MGCTPRLQAGAVSVLNNGACCRDDARSVLVTMSVELGGTYLPFVLDVLQSALPVKGYMAPVLGYTLHAVLAGLVKVRCCWLQTQTPRS